MSNTLVSKIRTFVSGLSPSYILKPHRDESDKINEHLIAQRDRNSFIAEQYKLLCRKLFFLAKERPRPLQIVLFTSCQPKEGKTTTASNLAVTLSLCYQKKVLLIDGDLRRSSIHRIFQIPRKPGLVEVVEGDCALEDVVVHYNGIDGLDILAAGTSSVEPGDLFNSRRFQDFLERLRSRYEYILIDAPPILKVSDASTLGILSDAVLFIVRAGTTPRDIIQEGLDTLEKTGAPLTTIVLVNTPSFPDYYSYITKPSYREYYKNRYIGYGGADEDDAAPTAEE